MKTIKLLFMLVALAALGSSVYGQKIVHTELTVTISGLDYSSMNPDIGIVYGTYKYHFSYRLSKEGYIESIHWNARDFNLVNQNGEKIIVIDSGHDTYGMLWAWFNTPGELNGNIPEIVYSCPDGWLDEYMTVQPSEGVSVEMSCKVMCRGSKIKLPILAVFHINANGVNTVDFIKP